MNNSRIEQLKKFIEEEPEDPFNIYALANEYINQKPELALKYLELLLKDHPAYLGTYYIAGKLYLSFQDTIKGKEVFEKGIAIAQLQNNLKTMAELKNALNELLEDEY